MSLHLIRYLVHCDLPRSTDLVNELFGNEAHKGLHVFPQEQLETAMLQDFLVERILCILYDASRIASKSLSDC